MCIPITLHIAQPILAGQGPKTSLLLRASHICRIVQAAYEMQLAGAEDRSYLEMQFSVNGAKTYLKIIYVVCGVKSNYSVNYVFLKSVYSGS